MTSLDLVQSTSEGVALMLAVIITVFIGLLPLLTGYALGYTLDRALAARAQRKRLRAYTARRAAELKLEHAGEQRLLLEHHADKVRGGVYRSQGSDPDTVRERSGSGSGNAG